MKIDWVTLKSFEDLTIRYGAYFDTITQCSLEYFLACLDANLTTASDNHEELTKIVMLEAYSVYRINIYNPNTIVPPELVVSLKAVDTNTITYGEMQV